VVYTLNLTEQTIWGMFSPGFSLHVGNGEVRKNVLAQTITVLARLVPDNRKTYRRVCWTQNMCKCFSKTFNRNICRSNKQHFTNHAPHLYIWHMLRVHSCSIILCRFSPVRSIIFRLSTSSTPVMGLTQPRIQWVPGVKRSGPEVNHSSPNSAEHSPIRFHGLVLS
jgi:hypothetical protein